MAHHKQGLTNWRGERGRSSLVSFEMQHDTNEDSPIGGEEEPLAELHTMPLPQPHLTPLHNTNEDSPTGGEEEGGAGLFGLRLSHMSCDEVELEEIVKSRFHMTNWHRH